eukprot:scaffold921_cov126-Cylindrotheca_fusiformis.AAC.14
MSAGTDNNRGIVDELLDQVSIKQQKNDQTKRNEILSSVEKLISNGTATITDETNETAIFDDLIGFYNVSYTLTSTPGDNPVGGKWTRSQWRLWKIRRTLQHVLPPVSSNAVAQVVNAIFLECLWGVLPIWIVLRGDAVPISSDSNNPEVQQAYSKKKRANLVPSVLTKRTVRVYFDRPRIAVGNSIVSFGPTSSVVIDTPYVDDRIRIGVGGTSGTKFVFARVSEDDDEAKEAWQWILEQPTMITKTKASVGLILTSVISTIGFRILEGGVGKWLSGALAAVSLVSLALVVSSTGGIETRGPTFTPGLKPGSR